MKKQKNNYNHHTNVLVHYMQEGPTRHTCHKSGKQGGHTTALRKGRTHRHTQTEKLTDKHKHMETETDGRGGGGGCWRSKNGHASKEMRLMECEINSWMYKSICFIRHSSSPFSIIFKSTALLYLWLLAARRHITFPWTHSYSTISSQRLLLPGPSPSTARSSHQTVTHVHKRVDLIQFVWRNSFTVNIFSWTSTIGACYTVSTYIHAVYTLKSTWTSHLVSATRSRKTFCHTLTLYIYLVYT